jgi:hypothetical protein
VPYPFKEQSLVLLSSSGHEPFSLYGLGVKRHLLKLIPLNSSIPKIAKSTIINTKKAATFRKSGTDDMSAFTWRRKPKALTRQAITWTGVDALERAKDPEHSEGPELH